MSVTLMVRVKGKPGHGGELAGLLQPVGPDNDIEGCLGMEVFAGTGNPDDVLILEYWESVDAHKAFIAGVIASGGLDAMLAHADDLTRTYYVETA